MAGTNMPTRVIGRRVGMSTLFDSTALEAVDLTLEAYVGEAKLTVSELNDLVESSIVTLNTQLNQSIELKLNGVTIGRGELVAVGDKFAVKLTEFSA